MASSAAGSSGSGATTQRPWRRAERENPGGLYPTLKPGSKASKGHVICLTSLGTKSRPGQGFQAVADGVLESDITNE